MDFHKARTDMVQFQIIARGIKDKNVINAMLKVPRHLFVKKNFKNRAYDDNPLPIGKEQTISQPYMVAIMTSLLQIKPNHKVLEIGTGSGYQTAILAEIAKEVYTVERIKELSVKSEKLLGELGYNNIHYRVGDGSLGWEEKAPFNGIICTAAAPDIPEQFKKQLANNGKIVIPVGDRYGQQLVRIVKKNNRFISEKFFLCAFVPLIGEQGWRY